MKWDIIDRYLSIFVKPSELFTDYKYVVPLLVEIMKIVIHVTIDYHWRNPMTSFF